VQPCDKIQKDYTTTPHIQSFQVLVVLNFRRNIDRLIELYHGANVPLSLNSLRIAEASQFDQIAVFTLKFNDHNMSRMHSPMGKSSLVTEFQGDDQLFH